MRILISLLCFLPMLSSAQNLPLIPSQTVLGNGTGAVGVPTALALGNNLIETATTLTTTQPINAQTGTSYTIATTDAGKLVTFANGSAIAVTLPQATGSYAAGFAFDVENVGTATATITPTTSTINGAASLAVKTNTGCTVTSDGTNWQVSACTSLVSGATITYPLVSPSFTGTLTGTGFTVDGSGNNASRTYFTTLAPVISTYVAPTAGVNAYGWLGGETGSIISGGFFYPVDFKASSDTAAGADGSSISGILHLDHKFGGGSGSFHTADFDMHQIAPTSNTASTAGFYTNTRFTSNSNINDNGVNGASSGQLFGTDSVNWLSVSATHFVEIIGNETDVAINSTSSALDRIGQIVVNTSNGGNPGTRFDAAYAISSQPGTSVGFDYGYAVGSYSQGNRPINTSTGVMLGCYSQYGQGLCGTVDYGIDLRRTTANSGYLAFNNAGIDNAGNVYGSNLYSTGSLTAQSATIASIAPAALKSYTGGLYYGASLNPAITITAPPSGGTQATATTATMQLNDLALLTASGFTNGDVVTLGGNTGTEPTVTLNVSTFTGYITGSNAIGYTLHVSTGPSGAALSIGQILTGAGIASSGIYIASGSGATWLLTGLNGQVGSVGSPISMTATGVTSFTAGSLSTPVVTPTTSGGSGTATFNFGFGVLTVTVTNAGAGYPAYPLPAVYVSGGVGGVNADNLPARLIPTMTVTTVPLAINSPVNATAGGVPNVLYQWGVPVILSSGTISTTPSASGGFTPTTTFFANTCVNGCYIYINANAINGSNSAGIYWATCSSTSNCSIFNTSGANPLPLGTVPSIQGTSTSWGTVAGGTSTITTSSDIALVSVLVKGGSIGPNGSLSFKGQSFRPSNANNVTEKLWVGTSAGAETNTLASPSIASVIWYGVCRTWQFLGAQNAFSMMLNTTGTTCDQTSVNNGVTILTNNFASNEYITISGNLVTSANDYIQIIGGNLTAVYAP